MNTQMRTAVITGAAQGLGRVTAETLVEAGFAVMLLDLQPLDAIVTELRAKGHTAHGLRGDIADEAACEVQFRNSFLLGCAGAWSLHPSQVAIAKRVFSPDPKEVAFARRILEAMPDGSGVVMIDGKMQDDATWKQAKVIVDLAKQVAAKDPEMAKAYGL